MPVSVLLHLERKFFLLLWNLLLGHFQAIYTLKKTGTISMGLVLKTIDILNEPYGHLNVIMGHVQVDIVSFFSFNLKAQITA